MHMATRSFRILPLLLLLCACRDAAPPEGNAEGPDAADLALQAPSHARVLLENDYVLAAEFRVPPGEELPEHYGRNRAVYALSDYRLAFDGPEGRRVAESRAGDIAWHAAGVHSVRNVGETEARFLVVFRKLSRLFEYSFTDEARDFTCLAGDRSEVLLENEFMRVARFTLAPGDGIGRHRGLNRVMYPLSEFSLRYESDRLDLTEEAAPGTPRYLPAEPHAVSNVGETPACYLMFELRQ